MRKCELSNLNDKEGKIGTTLESNLEIPTKVPQFSSFTSRLEKSANVLKKTRSRILTLGSVMVGKQKYSRCPQEEEGHRLQHYYPQTYAVEAVSKVAPSGSCLLVFTAFSGPNGSLLTNRIRQSKMDCHFRDAAMKALLLKGH